jgi:hypothetical protein
MKRFVTTLIDSYNGLVDQYDTSRNDFDAIKGYFTLYHDNSSSFNVTVMQSYSIYTDYLTLIFSPIKATQPQVTIDQTEAFLRLFPNASLTFGDPYYLQKNFVATEYNGNIVRYYAIMEMPLSAFSPSSDYVTDANQIAQYMYNQDQSQVPPIPTASQTLTVSVSVTPVSNLTVIVQPPTTYIQSNTQDWLSMVNDNPYIKTIVTFFGGIIAFVVFVIGVFAILRQKDRRTAIKKLLGMDKPEGNKPENEKA